MKRSFKLLFIIGILLLPIIVRAGSVSVSKSNLNIKPGGRASFVVKANSAAGRVDISSSDSSVATISSSSVWLDNDSKTINVTGKAEGSATIKVVLTDVASYDGTSLSNTYSIKVTVKKPEVDTRSTNNNLDRLDVEGYEIVKVDNNTFSLDVKNSVTSVNIIATPQDSKSSVIGTGNVNLEVGKNSFDVVVTAENGSKQTYTIIINRKDNKYGLEDIDDALGSADVVNIILKDDDIITKDLLEKIKKSEKMVHFNMYSGEKIIYSWIIDGSKLGSVEDIKTDVSFDIKEDFEEKTNYASGVYIIFNSINLGDGVTVRIYVGDKFKDGDKINIYTYEDDEVVLVEENVEIKDGYLELSPSKEDYLLSKSSIIAVKEDKKEKKFNPFVLITIMETLVIGGIVGVMVYKKKFIKIPQ